jgi:hypothetical protein
MANKTVVCGVTTEFILRNKKNVITLMQELEKYLQTKLPKNNGEYYCLDKTGDDYDARWEMTCRFLSKRGLNTWSFFEILRDEYDMDFTCEGDIANGYWTNQLKELSQDLAKEGEVK